jgi:hypothetical protein
VSLGRQSRRAGLAAERLAGWRRRMCPGCHGLVLMNMQRQEAKHEDPPCEWFCKIILKANTMDTATPTENA